MTDSVGEADGEGLPDALVLGEAEEEAPVAPEVPDVLAEEPPDAVPEAEPLADEPPELPQPARAKAASAIAATAARPAGDEVVAME